MQSLFGYDPNTKYIVLGIVALQLFCAILLRDSLSYTTPLFWILAYVIGMFFQPFLTILGGTCNQALFLAIHELSHNLGFKDPSHNKLFGALIANVPIGVPYAASFKVV